MAAMFSIKKNEEKLEKCVKHENYEKPVSTISSSLRISKTIVQHRKKDKIDQKKRSLHAQKKERF